MVAQAKRRGFADLTSYVLQLVKADAKEHGEAFPNAEAVQEDEGNPLEDFRAAWEEIRRGETLSLDEFLKAVEDGG
ncbi:MAG: hypothetical protein JNL42_23805 [Anaerolineae bacterium]|nr:hypothetical protein [Anaerolineae bacterium]